MHENAHPGHLEHFDLIRLPLGYLCGFARLSPEYFVEFHMNYRMSIFFSCSLELYRKVPNLRILACGGDGTVSYTIVIYNNF